MIGSCQDPTPNAPDTAPVLAIAGVAGSGKTTLGRSLARVLHAPLLDLDSLTNPLLDQLSPLLGDTHWNSPGPHRDAIRTGRYAVMLTVAKDLVEIGLRPVLVAPFTAELAGGAEWRDLVEAVAPALVTVIHIDGPPELFAHRRSRRDVARDRHRADDPSPAPRPSIPHLRAGAAARTDDQVAHVLAGLQLTER